MTHLEAPPGAAATICTVWARRRWIYAVCMLVAILRIPARVGFRFLAPMCDTHLTLANARLSLTKVPHILLFAGFFVLTAFQFERRDQRAIWWSLLAVAALGLVVELEEGATRTGNCRLTDVVPDIFGALLAASVLWAVMTVRQRAARGAHGQTHVSPPSNER